MGARLLEDAQGVPMNSALAIPYPGTSGKTAQRGTPPGTHHAPAQLLTPSGAQSDIKLEHSASAERFGRDPEDAGARCAMGESVPDTMRDGTSRRRQLQKIHLANFEDAG